MNERNTAAVTDLLVQIIVLKNPRQTDPTSRKNTPVMTCKLCNPYVLHAPALIDLDAGSRDSLS